MLKKEKKKGGRRLSQVEEIFKATIISPSEYINEKCR